MKGRLVLDVPVSLSMVIAFLCCFVLFIQVGFARKSDPADPAYFFYKGNTLYEEGKYDEAVQEYMRLLDRGLESGNLYYNIGNCYFKKGQLGKAILNYERAMRLIPRDSDLKSNYAFAVSRIQFDVASKPSWFERVMGFFDFLPLDEITLTESCTYLLLVLFLILSLFIGGLRRYTLSVTFCLLTVMILLAFPLYSRTALLDTEAVVIAGNPEARYEPLEKASTHFLLYEGMKVTVLQSQEGWTKIRRADGKIGWIKSGDIEKI